MTAQYHRSGIRFLYPENWQIADDQTDQRTRSVMVQAPCGAFWSIDLQLQMDDCHELAAEALRSMRQDYADLEAEPVTERVGGTEAVGYNLHFCYMDFIISACIRSLGTHVGSIVVLYQAEDRDFERLQPVFHAMSESIFQMDNDPAVGSA